ncbi:hypothetical protein [Actinophytocola sp.]|uniref:hypothetical protein n=1 Tax=Actinophytocola sp. TaxID=1872138 RepID=UPI002ED0AA30
MKIRLMGTREEIDAVLPVLDAVLDVVEVSSFYPNRGTSKLGRVYLEARGTRTTPGPAPVQVDATRLDRTRGAVEPGGRGEITS